MPFGLIIVGDEILSGRREDKHLRRVIELLGERGLQLDWVHYVGDDRARQTELLTRTFASGDIVFSTGGIGATPDDHTRQAAAAALGVPLVLHAEARVLIAQRIAQMANGDPDKADLDRPENRQRFKMGEFPAGAQIIPNPYNQIPGFSVGDHHFVPGFPVMAWPMIESVLDARYPHLFHRAALTELSLIVPGGAEAQLTPLMEQLEAEFSVKVFSLPSVGDPACTDYRARHHIELGVKGETTAAQAAFAALRERLAQAGCATIELPASGQ